MQRSRKRSSAFFAVAWFVVATTVATAAPPVVPASPPATACATPGSVPAYDLVDAFAYDLGTPALLHFVSEFDDVAPATRELVVKTALNADARPAEREVRTALANLCPSTDAAEAKARVVALVSEFWNEPALEDERNAKSVTDVLDTAIDALANVDRLTASQYDTALAPFAALATPTQTADASCATSFVHAKTIHVVRPIYPAAAIATRASGTFAVKIVLTDAGDVRTATVYKAPPDDGGAGTRALARAAILTAAATTYAPALVRCKPVGSAYIFRVDFNVKRACGCSITEQRPGPMANVRRRPSARCCPPRIGRPG